MILLLAACPALAERPSAMKLFPEETVVFVRIANAHEFGERLSQTSTGRMLRDPQLKPLVEQLYGDIGDIYAEKAEDKVGISWEDLKKLPQGEVAFGVIARPSGKPAFLLLVDQGEEPSVADGLLDRALELAEEKGAEFTKEEIGGVEVTVVRDADNQDRMFGAFERENTIVVATDPDVLRNVLWQWDGGEAQGDSSEGASEDISSNTNPGDETDDSEESDEDSDSEEEEFIPSRTLAENDRFATIVQQCRRPQDPPPQLLFFVDPIELVRSLGGDQGGVQFAMSMFPALGVDGLLAIGGAMTYATEQYDDLAQIHLLLENPRAGIMQLPAFESGDTTPQAFVPQAIESYLAWNWNLRTTYDRAVAMGEQFHIKPSVDEHVKKWSEPFGIDVLADVIDNLAGRFSWIIGYEKPAHFRGQRHVLAAELADQAAAIETLEKVMEKFPDMFEERQFGDVTYYAIMPAKLAEMEEDERPIDPFVAIMDGYVFVGGSCQLFERCVAARDGTIDRLVDSDDYIRTTEVLGRETAGTTPVLLTVGRYEETVQQWYDLLTSERSRELMDEHKEDNRFLGALAAALEQHQLPPFDVLRPYMAPGGAILYDTDTGYHGISFTLRNATE